MAVLDKHSQAIKYVQLFLFIVIMILTQYKLFIITFAILLAMIIYMTIISYRNRAFIWILTAYSLGYLFYLYSDRLIEEFSLSISSLMILNQCLLLIPIMIMVYVIKKFNLNWNVYRFQPDWKATISFPFIWSGFHTVSIKIFLLIAIAINIVVLTPFIQFSNVTATEFITFILLFSIVNAAFEEILWRGIILTRLVELAGEKAAVVFSSLAFGLSHLSYGYSLGTCLGFAIGGFFYAAITVRSGSIVPAIIWHIVLNGLMILTGVISYIG